MLVACVGGTGLTWTQKGTRKAGSYPQVLYAGVAAAARPGLASGACSGSSAANVRRSGKCTAVRAQRRASRTAESFRMAPLQSISSCSPEALSPAPDLQAVLLLGDRLQLGLDH